ncbi:pyridoxal 5'-phosphate synthase glutaminase subunit PdxT [Candidatus Acetothermia bacterium]|nr:pyridoxal 5'-phosphate synthase glutaminase subunit PdxT [Candidatus Acetothermia bacterium]MCI2427107.1 pyridoxal 5'-phosphate synthase glutaminase subunit PdxT [Candidatus Acetothermia bacterium]MCI2428849.1 pyridoxal 5'-phosphate synthase glutaminase subunit PdxT [Candidatus Acetothermia bacterium]
MRIGVLALQGAVREHLAVIDRLEHEGSIVKEAADLVRIDGLILPGGESTAISRLMDEELVRRLSQLARDGLPLFGTCAGMILLANQIEAGKSCRLNAIDITVHRNAFGRQIESFETKLTITGIGSNVPAVFIRAPYITRVGDGVQVLAYHMSNSKTTSSSLGFPVMAKEKNVLVASFHPELTDDLRIHRYFLAMVEAAN